MQAVRKHKDVIFADVTDGSTPSRLQVVIDPNKLPWCAVQLRSHRANGVIIIYFYSANKLTLGSSVAITGSICTTHAAQTELHPNSIEMIGSCDPVVS